MATDYDAPRTIDTDDSLDQFQFQARRSAPNLAVTDIDENDLPVAFDMLGADLFDEELTVPVIPMQADEFRCGRCFLVHHRSHRASAAQALCHDCA